MTAHIVLSRRIPMQQAHFDRWLELWQRTVDELFKVPMPRWRRTARAPSRR
ncbi:MAG: hypothetical protein IPM46_11810 [Flavobacteriales bacterium]|nr:hypothetical protein [Flavobacteriales bacterium]